MQNLIDSDFELLQEALEAHAKQTRRETSIIGSPMLYSFESILGNTFSKFGEDQKAKSQKLQEDIQLLKAKLIMLKRQQSNTAQAQP